jgi:exodeoxyribonuclease V alpha subunit
MSFLLSHLLERGSVSAFDLMLGKSLQSAHSSDVESVELPERLLGVYAAKAFRLGHMAIRWTGSRLQPAPQEVFTADGISVLDDETTKQIDQAIRRELQAQEFGRLIVEGEWIALPQAHAVEISLAKELVRLSRAPCATPVGHIPPDKTLNEGQQAVAGGAVHHALCSITGGPGTGKTYTAGRLLHALSSALSPASLRVALAAPTGRAVQTLEASIRSVLANIPSITIDAKTIHSLVLGPPTLLPYHMVIVDECSMIDSQMMLKLVQRLHDGTRVVLLGDPGQLPSIDPGQPFFDLLTAAQGQQHIGHFTLNTCQRTASTDMLEFAQLVRQGDREQLRMWLDSPLRNDVQFVDCTTPDEWAHAYATIDEVSVRPWRSDMALKEAKEQQKKMTVLTPTRKGPLGSDEMNRRAKGHHEKFCPVISLQNSYQLGVMNGDLGVLERHPVMDQIHFHHCTVPAVLCPRIEQAFAMTVHKSQGSEFERVVLLLPPRALIDRRLLYTAITRAKRQVVIMGSKEDFLNAVNRCEERVTTLSMRLQQLAD